MFKTGNMGRRPFLSAPVIAALLLFARMAAADEPFQMRASYAAVSGAFTPIWLAQDKGLFGHYGLQVDLRLLPPATATQALLGKSMNIIIPGGEFIEAALAGEKLVYVAGIANKVVLSLYSRADVQSVADLRGKTVSALSPGSTSDFLVRILLQQARLVPGKDVKILYLKTGPEIFGALNKGVIDAGILSAPMTLKARQSGFRELMNGAKEEVPMIHAAFGTTRDFLAVNRSRVKSFLQAYVEGIRLAKANRQEAKEVIQKYTKTGSDDELNETYDTFVNVWETAPYVSSAAVKTLLEFATHPNAKTARPEQFIDNSLIAELDKTGFIKGLYK